MDEKETAILKGKSARALLADPTLVEAFDAVEANCVREWRNTPITASDKREAAYYVLLALGQLKGEITKIIDNGAVAEASLRRAGKDR